MSSLSALKAQISKCQICHSELPLGANPVMRGNQTAKILIAGQAPGIKVHQTSIPFNDPSGVRLRSWMAVDETTFYNEDKFAIVPMGFCYPGRGKTGDLPPRTECAATWHEQLLTELSNIELILAIGQYAQRYYLGNQSKKTLTETVKNWQMYSPKIIPLPHPSPRNNIWLKKNQWFEQEVIPQLKTIVRALLTNN